VLVDVERRIIDPDRPATADRQPVQASPQPRNRRDAGRHNLPYLGQVERYGIAQREYSADLGRDRTAVICQLQQVLRSCPIDRTFLAARHCR